MAGMPNGSRCSMRSAYRRAYGAGPREEELPALLDELERELALMGVKLDFSEWEGLCVGPRHNQPFVVRKRGPLVRWLIAVNLAKPF